MSRKVVPFPQDDSMRLRRLLGFVEAAAAEAPPITEDALRPAGFSTEERPPPDAFAGRRVWAWIQEREARRGPDGRLRRR